MTPKLLGALLTVGCGLATSFLLVKREKERLRAIDAWLVLLRYLRTQIDCYLLPIAQILEKAPQDFFLPLRGGARAESMEALLECSLPYLDAESAALLREFASEVGGSYREEQLKRCDHYLSCLEAQKERLSGELPKRTKLYHALFSCLSMGIAILLW